eukprot:6263600-Amphidinium_carterae.1
MLLTESKATRLQPTLRHPGDLEQLVSHVWVLLEEQGSTTKLLKNQIHVEVWEKVNRNSGLPCFLKVALLRLLSQ